MLDYFEIGQRIRYSRKKAGISQESLAEKAGISVTHMSHIETGNTRVSLSVIVDISEALGVTVDSLIFDHSVNRMNTASDELLLLLSSCSQEQIPIILDTVSCLKQSLDRNYNK